MGTARRQMAAPRRLARLAEQLSPSPASAPDLSQPPYERRSLLRPGALEGFDREAWERDGCEYISSLRSASHSLPTPDAH